MSLNDVELHAVGEQRASADLPDSWVALQGINGGLVASIAVQAAAMSLDDPTRTLRAATFAFLRGTEPGPTLFEVDPVRIGRALATMEVTASQDGRPVCSARCHFSPAWDGGAFSDLTAAPARPPDDAVRLELPDDAGHFHHVETWLDPTTNWFVGAPEARWRAWVRPLDGDTVSLAWLTMLGDYFPPAVFVSRDGPTRAVSIEYSIQIHTSDPVTPLRDGEFLACDIHAYHSAEGFAVEDGTIWAPDGTLLATTRQSRLSG